MLSQIHLERYADVLIWGLKTARKTVGGKYKKGDIIRVAYDLDAISLAEIFYRKVLEQGWIPAMELFPTSQMDTDLFRIGNDEQIELCGFGGFSVPWRKMLFRKLNGSVNLLAPASLGHLAGADPKRIAAARLAKKSFYETTQARENAGKLGWTICRVPTQALAEAAGMTLQEYAKEVIKACYLDSKDPVKEWEALRQKAVKIRQWLKRMEIESLHIESENTDLRVSLGARRKWVGVTGHNIPSFELFTSPDWRGVEGTYYANTPSFKEGNRVRDVKFVFKKGEIVEAKAEEGEEFVKKQIALDAGARRTGEISLTDKRFSRITRFMADTLFDENVGGKNGNFHLAVGFSYPETYDGSPKELTKKMKKRLGFNDSAQHWDFINTEKKRVTAYLLLGGTKVIYENGMFMI